jgi:dihydropteroate synthase
VGSEVVSDLTASGFPLPDDAEAALLGLPAAAGEVAGARPMTLRAVPHLIWWAGRRDELLAWCRRTGQHPESVWETSWALPDRTLSLAAAGAVVGVLNVTPDSFSDGGQFSTLAAQIRRVREMLQQGALLVDVGGESTRPGHVPVDPDTEWARLEPLLEALTPAELGRISLDTRHGTIARRAAGMGVAVINDVSGRPDAPMRDVLTDARTAYIYMYNRAEPFLRGTFRVGAMLREMDAALYGLSLTLPDGLGRVAVDPGLGFAYGMDENVTVVRHLGLFRLFDRPLLVGGSRKRFVGRITGREVGERDAAGTALAALLRVKGADLVRTHAVREAVDALRMAEAIG